MKKKSSYLIALIIFKTVLEISYYYFINPNFYYQGFAFNFNYLKYCESTLMLIWMYLLMPKNDEISSVAANIMYVLIIIPIVTMYALKDESRIYFYSVVLSFSILILTIKFLPRIVFKVRFSFNKILMALSIIITVVVYGVLIKFNGMPNIRLLDFNEVYNIRSQISYGFEFMKYLVTWQGAIINVFLMIITLFSGKRWTFFFIATLQVILYLLTSHKTFIFYPLVIFILLNILNRQRFNIGKIAAIGSTAGIIFSLAVYKVIGNLMLPSMIINRIFFLPAQISYQYYEFFSRNGFVYLSHSIFSFIFQSPVYSIDPIRLIGQAYYSNNWPNTGYLGDAYMNFGITGMIVFSILFAVVLKVIECLANTPFKTLIAKAFVILFMFSTANIGLLTSMLNGGLLLFIIILYLYNDNDMDKELFNSPTSVNKVSNTEKEG